MRFWLDLLLPAAYRAVFADEFTLHDNPFLLRDVRRDARRPDRILLIVMTLSTLWLILVAVAAATYWLAGAGYLRHGIPFWLGGSYGAMLFLFFSGIHVVYIYHAAWRRTHTFFLQEYRQNTLASLLGTRTEPFQIVVQAAVYPLREAMVIAAIGLPFYACVWSLGGADLSDILGIYLIYAMLAFRPPRWSVPVFAGLPADEIAKKQRAARGGSAGVVWTVFSCLFVCQNLLTWAFGPNWGVTSRPSWFNVPRPARAASASLLTAILVVPW